MENKNRTKFELSHKSKHCLHERGWTKLHIQLYNIVFDVVEVELFDAGEFDLWQTAAFHFQQTAAVAHFAAHTFLRAIAVIAIDRFGT